MRFIVHSADFFVIQATVDNNLLEDAAGINFFFHFLLHNASYCYSFDWLAAVLLAAASICPAPGGPPVGVELWYPPPPPPAP
jgi:hypothetical protein